MANNMYAHTKEAVRVKAKKCELNCPPEWRKFSVDPQITSLEVLYSLLAKAFDIKSDFTIKYKAYDPAGNEIYLSVLSDWDLDAAFLRIHNLSLQTATEPCLTLQIDIKPFTEVRDWDVDTAALPRVNAMSTASREFITPLQQSFGASQKYVQSMQTKLPGLIMNHVERTFSIVQKAFNLSEETMASLPPREPLSDAEFRLFLDSLGQIQRCDELRKVIFLGGIDSGLRRVVWKHILNVYPAGMTGKQRMDYMKNKSEHYFKLRETWKSAIKQGHIVGELAYVTSMVKKDVLRTDRLHPFYAGSDDNQNIASLFNILTTYALNHPTVSYCQGMSDIASPLLVTMNDEAQAYICFCAIMARLRANFMLDGIAMTQKFAHLTEALSFYDPEFWEYLKSQQADDLLFCYRWLLLELKREFPFEDALRMLEVQWSSLKYENSREQELPLYEKEFVPMCREGSISTTSSSSAPILPLNPSCFQIKSRENPYTKVCALRRQSSSTSLSSLCSSFGTSCKSLNSVQLDGTKRLNQSLDDHITRRALHRRRHTSNKAHQSFDESRILCLFEGVEEVVDKKKRLPTTVKIATEDNHNDNNDYEDDDEVFEEVEKKIHQDFHFHPTNPFREDAEMNTQAHILPDEIEQETKSPKIANTFLSPSTTPPNDNDGIDRRKIDVIDKQLDEIIKAKRMNDTTSLQTSGFKNLINLQNKSISHCNALNSFMAKQTENAPTGNVLAGENVTKKISSSGGGGHFKELKEKIAATSKRGLIFDDLRSSNGKPQQKLVKNFSEFLNFTNLSKGHASNKVPTNSTSFTNMTKITATPSPTSVVAQSNTHFTDTSPSPVVHPLVKLSKSNAVNGSSSSFDDSDSSSVPETTGSCSTAPTAIQQSNNLSNYSLHLESDDVDKENNLDCNNATPPITFDSDDYDCRNDDDVTPDDQDQDYYPMTTAVTQELRLEADNLDRKVFGIDLNVAERQSLRSTIIEYEKFEHKESLDLIDARQQSSDVRYRRQCFHNRHEKGHSKGFEAQHNGRNKRLNIEIANSNIKNDSDRANRLLTSSTLDSLSTSFDGLRLNPFIDESMLSSPATISHNISVSSLPEVIVPMQTPTDLPNSHMQLLANTPIEMATNASEELSFNTNTTNATNAVNETTLKTFQHNDSNKLPPPSEFGGGNPFLIFLCLTLLLQHRNTIMKSGLDYNEIAMHFDKMVRKHDVTRVLNQARRMYIEYLKSQAQSNGPSRGHKYPNNAAATASSAQIDFNKNPQNQGLSSSSTPSINES